jgi:hypothetical protein
MSLVVSGAHAAIRSLDAPVARVCPLPRSLRIGRSVNSHLVLTGGRVSSEQAVIRHVGGGEWVIRDLGSKNGTFLNQRPLAIGDSKLAEGDLLGFGESRATWTFSPGSPCELLVIRAGQDWVAVPAGERLLALPSSELPDATLFHRSAGWFLEVPGTEPSTLSDGQTLTLSGYQYRVWISNEMDRTEDVVTSQRRLVDATLRLSVSRDEEQVEGELQLGAERFSLLPRVYLYVLVALARYHEEDARNGLPSTERGWRYADDVARSLGLDQQALNLQVYRARQVLAKLGFEDPIAIVERRAITKEIRLGIPADRVVVTNL